MLILKTSNTNLVEKNSAIKINNGKTKITGFRGMIKKELGF